MIETLLQQNLKPLQYSHNDSSIPCTNVAIEAFAAMFLEGGKK